MSSKKWPDKSQIDEMWREFATKNPNATPAEAWHQLINFIGPTEPTELLEESNEPSLEGESSPRFEAYRFEHIGDRVFPSRIIRVQRDGQDCRCIAKIRDVAADGEYWVWKVVRDSSISEANFDTLADLLNRGGFWEAAYRVSEAAVVLGASSTTITGRRGDRYHAIDRFNSFPKEVAEAFRQAELLAGLNESIL